MDIDNKHDKEVRRILKENNITDFEANKVNVKLVVSQKVYKVYYDEKYIGSFKIN